MTLQYLVFDFTEDTEGIGTFEAMASTTQAEAAQVEAEIAQVLAWANALFPLGRGELSAGADWDFDLQEPDEGAARRTFVVSISGTASFCEAVREQFALD
ncbi:hypothetical protein RCH10_002565 [Variovorax sp. GrIS 2.14]|jgi:hypothetical protein|uniref:hypothetical protein n=1 Tax=Variovorax sp. GrIS 2.14 TaxID=3071709 RepID=UPI0038F7B179